MRKPFLAVLFSLLLLIISPFQNTFAVELFEAKVKLPGGKGWIECQVHHVGREIIIKDDLDQLLLEPISIDNIAGVSRPERSAGFRIQLEKLANNSADEGTSYELEKDKILLSFTSERFLQIAIQQLMQASFPKLAFTKEKLGPAVNKYIIPLIKKKDGTVAVNWRSGKEFFSMIPVTIGKDLFVSEQEEVYQRISFQVERTGLNTKDYTILLFGDDDNSLKLITEQSLRKATMDRTGHCHIISIGSDATLGQKTTMEAFAELVQHYK